MLSALLLLIGIFFNGPAVMGFDLSSPYVGATISSSDADNRICPGTSVTFTAVAIGGTATSYNWYKGGLHIEGQVGNTYTTSDLKDGEEVFCIVGVGGTFVFSNSIFIQVGNNTPYVEITSNDADNIVCAANDDVIFNATAHSTGGGTVSYQWKVNGSPVGYNQSAYRTTTLTNDAIVTCEITVADGECLTAVSDISNEIKMTVMSVANPSVSIVSDDADKVITPGTLVTFTASTLNTDGYLVNYQWTVGGSNVGSNQNIFTTSELKNGDIVECHITVEGTGCWERNYNSSLLIQMGVLELSGISEICVSGGDMLLATIGDGEWSSSNESVAFIDQEGYVTGLSPGTAIITYTLPSGTSATKTIIVVAPPNAGKISSETDILCIGKSTTLKTSGDAGGLWFSNKPEVATIDGYTGEVTGVSEGNVILSYMVKATETCPESEATYNIFIPGPPVAGQISGKSTIAIGELDQLSVQNNSRPGAWSSNNPSVATVDETSGLVTAVGNGNVKILFTVVGFGACAVAIAEFDIVVASTDAGELSGIQEVCVGRYTMFSSTVPGGTWTTSNSDVATVDGGFVIGVSAGDATITYTVSGGAFATRSVTVKARPGPPEFGTVPAFCSGDNKKVSDLVDYLTYTGTLKWYDNTGTGIGDPSATVLVDGGIYNVSQTENGCEGPKATIRVTVNTLLTPEVSIVSDDLDNVFCAATSVTFTATPSYTGGGTVSYQWMVNGSNVGTNQNTYTTTALVDKDAVTCEISITGGECLATSTAKSDIIKNMVTPLLTPAVSIFSEDEYNAICAGTQVTFTATPSNYGGGKITYQWKKNGGDVGTNSPTYITTDLVQGDIVNVVITIDEGGGEGIMALSAPVTTCLSATTATSNYIQIDVNPLVTPEVSIYSKDADNIICAGTAVDFSATAENLGNGTVFHQWKVNGNNVGTNQGYYFGTSLANNDVVTCEITVTGGTCLSQATATSNSITMTVNPLLTPEVSIVSDDADNTICAGNEVTFTATPSKYGSGEVSYQWKKNDVNVGTNSSTYATDELVNGDVVKVEITISEAPVVGFIGVPVGSCLTTTTATSNTITTTVNPLLTPQVTIASSDADNIICAGTEVTFTATPSNVGGGAVAYLWKKNDAAVGTSNPTYVPSELVNGDDVKVVIVIKAGTCLTTETATSNTIETTVNPNLTPEVSILSNDEDNNICVGTSVTFAATPLNYGGGSVSYQWKKNNVDVGTDLLIYTTTGLVNNDAVKVVITVIGGTCLTSPTATSNTIITTVNPLPTQPSTISGSSPVCEGSTQKYAVTNVPGITYTWSFSGTGWVIENGQGTNEVLVTVGASNTTITVTPSNGCGNGPVRTMSVTYKPLPSVTDYLVDGVSDPDRKIEINYGCASPVLKVNATGSSGLWDPLLYTWYRCSSDGSNKVAVTTIVDKLTSYYRVPPANGYYDADFGDQKGIGVGTHYYVVGVKNGCGTRYSDVFQVVVKPAAALGDYNAKSYYTGPKFIWTSTPTSNTATATLTAFVKNAEGENCGDIATAMVSFEFRTSSGSWTKVPNGTNLPVGYVDPRDPTKGGTASVIAQLSIPQGQNSENYDIRVLIGGNYYDAYASKGEDEYLAITQLVVGKVVPGGSIAGGAGLANAKGAGYIQGALTHPAYLCFGVEYTQKGKSVTSPKGRVTLRVFSKFDRTGKPTSELHTYVVKSNAIAGLTITGNKATFAAKSNIVEEVADPMAFNGLRYDAVDGNCVMTLNVEDWCSTLLSNILDKVGITIQRNGGGIWYSNNWTNTKTEPNFITGGDILVVGPSTPIKNGTSDMSGANATASFGGQAFNVKVFGNPSSSVFNVQLIGTNDKVNMRVVDLSGRILEIRTVAGNSNVQFGSDLRPGTYIAEFKQGDQRRTVTLIKNIH